MSRPISVASWWLEFWRARGGATAVEFAFALPILLILSLGAIECGLIVFEFHRAGEAMRNLARSFEIDPPLSSFAELPTKCPGDAGCDDARINEAVQSIQPLMPNFTASNLQIVVDASGLDDADQTPGIVTPTLTVKVVDWQYHYLVLGSVVPGIGGSMTLPTFSTTRMLSTQLR